MERHARHDYYVEGEGVYTEHGVRPLAPPPPTTDGLAGGATATATAVAAAAPSLRFTRIGPPGRAVGELLRRRLAQAMVADGGQPGTIPAGYTYLGQFIDHDMTFDVTPVALGTDVTDAELIQARSPRLDLDSLYGGGPGRTRSRRFYAADRVHLASGRTAPSFGGGKADVAVSGSDLKRGAALGPAIIPDKRNDENLAVAQVHLAMIKFHNRVVGQLTPGGPTGIALFRAARDLVVRHYQWMIRTDFLPRMVTGTVLDDVFTNGRKLFDVGAVPTSMPAMPLEFSVAAYRHGHSMVRAAYNWNRVFDDGLGTLDLLFSFSGLGGFLNSGSPLPSNWIADFRRLFDFRNIPGRPDLVVPAAKFNRAMRIDANLVDPLSLLPDGIVGANGSTPPIEHNLAFRNLTRANMVRLASGQQMVRLLRSKGVAVTELTEEQIVDGSGGPSLAGLPAGLREALVARTPLWFYILREAEIGRGRLSGVGARIVAETFHRCMEASSPSIVRDPTWHPTLGPDASTFRMVDLLMVAFDGRADLLNPIGP